MDFNFTEEQGMLRDSLAKMLRDQYDFEARRKIVNSEAGWNKDMWMQFAELGLFMAPFSEEDGGLGGGPGVRRQRAHRVRDQPQPRYRRESRAGCHV